MTQEELLKVLEKTALGISKMLGNNTEVILHDLQDRKTVFLANGEITGRTLDYRIGAATGKAIANLADDEGHLIGQNQKSSVVDNIRASHFVYYDDDGDLAAMICINQDMGEYIKIRDALNHIINPKTIRNSKEESSEQTFLAMAKQVIVDTMDEFSSVELSTKEGKLKVIAQLFKVGIFNLRDAPGMVCSAMGISNSSLYNYINELKKRDLINTEDNQQVMYKEVYQQ